VTLRASQPSFDQVLTVDAALRQVLRKGKAQDTTVMRLRARKAVSGAGLRRKQMAEVPSIFRPKLRLPEDPP
jgi:hypothetical protein